MNEAEFVDIDAAINRLKAGDESARRELIQLSYDRLRKLARKMLKSFPVVKRWEETDDVFQRSTLRLWKSLEHVQPTDSRHFFNLAATQVRRELIELARSFRGPLGLDQNQESVASEAVNQQVQHGVQDETYDVTRLASWSAFHEKVVELPDDEQEVFALIWYQGLAQRDVATLLGASQKTISRRWLAASCQIAELLGHDLPE